MLPPVQRFVAYYRVSTETRIASFSAVALLASVRAALSRGDKETLQSREKAELQERLATLSNREREVLEGLREKAPAFRRSFSADRWIEGFNLR